MVKSTSNVKLLSRLFLFISYYDGLIGLFKGNINNIIAGNVALSILKVYNNVVRQ